MSNIIEYSSKATAVRGLKRAGCPDDRINEFLNKDGAKFNFDKDALDAALGLANVSEEDENLILTCGHAKCPSCGIHLSNGLMDFDSLADQKGEKEAFKLQTHEWSCMGCNAEWGAEIDAPKGAKGRKEPIRHYSNKSTIEGAVSASWDYFDSKPEQRRKDAIAGAVEIGITYYTARTQYQKWFKARKGVAKA